MICMGGIVLPSGLLTLTLRACWWSPQLADRTQGRWESKSLPPLWGPFGLGPFQALPPLGECPYDAKLAVLGLPWGSARADHWNTGSGVTGSTLGLPLPTSKSLEYRLWSYWGYLGATFANEQILGTQAPGLLVLLWGYICQRANHWNTGSGATWATLGLPLPTSKSL